MMKISALIPTYNRRKYIVRAIESILAQTAPVDEIVVVDDGSKDGTADVIQAKYGDRVRLIRQENAGVSGARLRAIQEARGEWIAFLDSDDEWFPDRQRELLSAAENLPSEVAWLFGNMRIVTDKGEGKTFFEHYGLTVPAEGKIFPDSLSIQFPFMFPMLQGSLIRRQALLDAGCFKEGLRSDDDFLAGFQIACRYKYAAIPSVVTKFYRTSDLFETSVEYNGVHGPDYCRSRMMAFSLAIKTTGKKYPWAGQYAHAVRGLCKLYVAEGKGCRRLALEQFRYEVSFKSAAFFCAVMFGGPGLYLWEQSAAMGRAIHKKLKTTSNPVPRSLESSTPQFVEPSPGDKRS
jgi:glycosyltransferase involved in cell wall biosynthesis